MPAFDLDAYKRQCRSIADAFRKLMACDLDDDAYAEVVLAADKVPYTAVMKIQQEVVLKGKSFRPIDACQF